MSSHALTIDLEDWHQLFFRRITGSLYEGTGDVVTDANHILELLDEFNICATFFVVGTVASGFPKLIRKIAERGHEIGSHTYNHKVFHSMKLADFKADLWKSRKQLQDLTGQPILGFRAPEFSVGSPCQSTFFEVLVEAGFQYDSSVFPISGLRYGMRQSSAMPFLVETPSGAIREFPLATWNIGRYRLPVAGGSFFRFLPTFFLRRVLTDLDANGHTGVFYFHPYEFHHGFLRLSGLTWRHRLQPAYLKYILLHNLFTSCILKRLKSILTEHQFLPLGEIPQ